MGEQLRVASTAATTATLPVSAPPIPAAGTPALFALMAGQHGVASTHQSRRLGVSRAVERRLMREGALHEPLPGVLGAGGIRPSYSSQAMTATLIPGVLALSHGAAARVHGLVGFERHPTLDVIGQRGAHLRVQRPVVSHYTRGPVADHLEHVGALAVTSIPLTLVLLAPDARPDQLQLALLDALRRGVTVDQIEAVLADWQVGGRAGPHRLAELLALVAQRPSTPATDLDAWRRQRRQPGQAVGAGAGAG